MPDLNACIIEPIWELLPSRQAEHPLGWHHRRVPDRVVVDTLVQVLVVGCA